MESKNRTASNYTEDDEDDENMKKFFALMKNFRNKLHQLQEIKNNNKRKRTSTSGGGWAPAFQPEDFTSEIQFKKHVPNPCINVGIGNQDISKHPVEPTSPNLKLTL